MTHVRSRASFIVPAYNEEFRIRGLLQTLTERSIAERCAVFVVCNGCTDRTSEVAREYVGVDVIDISARGKHHALNEGDCELHRVGHSGFSGWLGHAAKVPCGTR